MGARRRAMFAWAAVLAVWGVPPTAAAVTGSPGSLVLGPRVLVSAAGERMGEFAVAKDPSDPLHLVVAALDFDDESAPVTSVALVSEDGGSTWQKSRPFGGGSPLNYANEWVAIGPDGTVYYIALAVAAHRPDGKLINRLTMAVSHDRGHHWDPPRAVPFPTTTNGADHPSVFVTRKGTVLVCGNGTRKVDPSPGTPSLFQVGRSTDGGRNWTAGVPVGYDDKDAVAGDERSGHCNGIVQAPDGTLYTEIFNLGSEWITRSTDDGRTWGTVRKVSSVAVHQLESAPLEQAAILLKNKGNQIQLPSLVVSPRNGHVVNVGVDPATPSRPRRLMIRRSMDRGQSFHEIRTPEGPAPAGWDPVTQTAAFDAAGRLAVSVVYNSPGGLSKQFRLFVTPDEGKTWLPPTQFAEPTGPLNSWADPRTFRPNLAALPRATAYATQNHAEADPLNPLVWGTVTTATRPDQIQWGGDNWGMTTTPRGFLVMWEDHSQNGVSQLWARHVSRADP